MRRFAADLSDPSQHSGGAVRNEWVLTERQKLSERGQMWLRENGGSARNGDPSLDALQRLYSEADSLISLLKKQSDIVAGLRRDLSALATLGATLDSAPSDAGSAPSIAQFSQALSRVTIPTAMQLGGGQEIPVSSLQASVDTFRLAASLRGKRSLLAREKAILMEMDGVAGSLPSQVEALHAIGLQVFSALKQFDASETQLRREIGAPVASVGSRLPVWIECLFFSFCFSSGMLPLLAHIRCREERRAAHFGSVIRTVLHENPKARALPEKTGALRPLAAALNEMIDAWEQASERSRKADEGLDVKIRARTSELWKANKALREESEFRGKMERESNQTQKMDALGKLAGSIAHDFNNLLTIILGSVECARQRLGFNHQASSMLRTAEQAAERAAALTRPLLAFSRSQVICLKPLDINEVAREAASMLQRLAGDHVELNLYLQPQLPKIKANANQLQQVILNLGVNGRDAMNGRGTLTIVTREVPAKTHGENWIELAVSDTGCGMNAPTKARIFEPFFTTKPIGQGIGLGLATVFGIIKQCGGRLNVESEPGNGSTFRVLLPPATADEIAEAAASSALPEEPIDLEAPGYGTLLLVDDEDDIRELAGLTLESKGYKVLSAPDAEQAVLLAEKHGYELRALVTDIVMPGMSGLELAEVVSQMLPRLPILFVSGHGNDAISPQTLEAGGTGFLQKPYRGDDLAAKVLEVLRRPRPAPDSPLLVPACQSLVQNESVA